MSYVKEINIAKQFKGLFTNTQPTLAEVLTIVEGKVAEGEIFRICHTNIPSREFLYIFMRGQYFRITLTASV